MIEFDLDSIKDNLRDANVARQQEWDSGGDITPAYQGNELAGELGEALELAVSFIALGAAGGRAANIIKKLERERFGMVGSRASKQDLADELADVIICADLIAMKAGINLEAAVVEKFNSTSEKNRLSTRIRVK